MDKCPSSSIVPFYINTSSFVQTTNQYTSHWSCQIMCPRSSHNSIISYSGIRACVFIKHCHRQMNYKIQIYYELHIYSRLVVDPSLWENLKFYIALGDFLHWYNSWGLFFFFVTKFIFNILWLLIILIYPLIGPYLTTVSLWGKGGGNPLTNLFEAWIIIIIIIIIRWPYLR
jgi:hypothetical protein